MIRFIVPAALALSACTPPPAATPAPATPEQAEPAPPEGGVACNANAVQDLIGKRADDALVADARSRSGAKAVRMMRPGEAATMDFRTDRLNVHVDGNGVVTKLACG
jgi:hypothetical protein